MNNATRPADPSTISFAARCFAVVGERVEYKVIMTAPSYPRRFDSRAEAEAFAARTGREVVEVKSQILRRVSWT